MTFDVVAHADWGKDLARRWFAIARRVDGRWLAGAARPVYATADWFADLRDMGERLFLGVDFPLGLPLAYAEQVGVESFGDFLSCLQSVEWASFFDVAESADQITQQRPFYPMRPGGTRRQQLVDALGFSDVSQLFRQCDRATTHRRAAAPMFWTMGAQQVGKQMLTGWRELILPHLDQIALWPFDFADTNYTSSSETACVVAECYPGEYYHHLNISIGKGGKGSREARAACAGSLLQWAWENGVEVSAELHAQITSGFPNDDAFDATIGLFGMLNVLLGNRPTRPNLPENIRNIEGWIFGQTDLPR